MKGNFAIQWLDWGREPQNPPDPRFPKGKAIDITAGEAMTCSVDLPYPAKRCGLYTVRCKCCGITVGITTAGRPDDPVSFVVPCRHQPETVQ